MLNEYAANVSLLVVGFFEMFTIVYIYGKKKVFVDDWSWNVFVVKVLIVFWTI